MLVIEGFMLFDITGKDFSLATGLAADGTHRCYLLPEEWFAARGASHSSRLFASTQMDVLSVTLNKSNNLCYMSHPCLPSSRRSAAGNFFLHDSSRKSDTPQSLIFISTQHDAEFMDWNQQRLCLHTYPQSSSHA